MRGTFEKVPLTPQNFWVGRKKEYNRNLFCKKESFPSLLPMARCCGFTSLRFCAQNRLLFVGTGVPTVRKPWPSPPSLLRTKPSLICRDRRPRRPAGCGFISLCFCARSRLLFVGADGPVVVPATASPRTLGGLGDHGHSLKSLHPPPAALPSLPSTARRLWFYQPSVCGTKKRFRTIEPRPVGEVARLA